MKRRIYLPWNTPKNRIKEAEDARKNRLEIVQSLSWGQISRRELIKWGLFTTAGALAPIKGLNPFVSSAYAEVPTGAPSSPGLIGLEFTQPMLRLEVLPRNPISSLNPAPAAMSNQTLQKVDPMLGGGFGPIEGRPPGPDWAHQRFAQLPPKVAIEIAQECAKTNPNGNIPFKFHTNLPAQCPLAMWTFGGTVPPKLVLGRYGEPLIHGGDIPSESAPDRPGAPGRYHHRVRALVLVARARRRCVGWVEFFTRPNIPGGRGELGLASARPNYDLLRFCFVLQSGKRRARCGAMLGTDVPRDHPHCGDQHGRQPLHRGLCDHIGRRDVGGCGAPHA